MKKTLYILVIGVILICFSTITYAQSIKPELSFDNETYYLKYSEISPMSDGYMNEYLRNDETLDSWKQRVAVYHFPNLDSPLQAAKDLAISLKQANPDTKFQLLENKKTGETILDFFVVSKEEPVMHEYNVFRYSTEKGMDGLVAYQFAYRTYGQESFNTFKKAFKKNRPKWVNLIAKVKIPPVIEKPIN
ncbi:MAG: hypothetical protein P9L88_01240 [Candidatus Tantalella remota]|nr:hypothetical protein [Candidatus Tantalella remota]